MSVDNKTGIFFKFIHTSLGLMAQWSTLSSAI